MPLLEQLYSYDNACQRILDFVRKPCGHLPYHGEVGQAPLFLFHPFYLCEIGKYRNNAFNLVVYVFYRSNGKSEVYFPAVGKNAEAVYPFFNDRVFYNIRIVKPGDFYMPDKFIDLFVYNVMRLYAGDLFHNRIKEHYPASGIHVDDSAG